MEKSTYEHSGALYMRVIQDDIRCCRCIWHRYRDLDGRQGDIVVQMGVLHRSMLSVLKDQGQHNHGTVSIATNAMEVGIFVRVEMNAVVNPAAPIEAL
jgi:ATP-dependent helicase YprA (DUF1998 family)